MGLRIIYGKPGSGKSTYCFQEISKLIMYGNLDNNSILSSMADIFNRFDNNLSSDFYKVLANTVKLIEE